jgi:PRC-barrel domain
MKRIILTILGAAIAPTVFAAEYTVFRVCEDKHVLRTSDGAEAGHVEYVVLEPSSQRIVSTIVTGGVVGSRFVAVPFTAMQFTSDREIALTEITRERIVSAPAIERTQIVSRSVIEPTIIERTNNHFGVQAGVQSQTTTNVQDRERTRTGVTTDTTKTQPGRSTATAPGTQPGESNPPDAPATSPREKRAADSGSKQPGQNPPGIGEKLPGKTPAATPDPQGRRPNQRSGERTAEPQEPQPRREGTAPEKAKEAPDRATEKVREQTNRAQDQAQSLKDQAERKTGLNDQPQPKSADQSQPRSTDQSQPKSSEPDKKKKPGTEEPRQ